LSAAGLFIIRGRHPGRSATTALPVAIFRWQPSSHHVDERWQQQGLEDD